MFSITGEPGDADGIAVLTLNRPRRLNALAPDLRDALMSTFPKYECWLGLLVFQELANVSSAALVENRSRAVPSGTVGGRMATTR